MTIEATQSCQSTIQIKSNYLLRRPSSVAQARKYRPTTTMQIQFL